MLRNVVAVAIPLLIYIILYKFIDDNKNLLLITILISTIIFWATSIVEDYQTSLIFLFSTLVLSLSTKQIIFSGFASSAFWLVFAGMLIAIAIKNVKLSDRFSQLFIKLKTASYLKILIYVSVFALLFSFIMPSGIGRVVILVPIGIVVAKNFGFKDGSKGYIGILLTFIMSTSIPAFSILPANAPNMILSGLTNQVYDYELFYSQYLLANFLVLGFLKNIIIVSLIYYYYKDTPIQLKKKEEKIKITKNEKIVIGTILVMLSFWTTDFLHGISPDTIAIAGILFLLNPSIGILKSKDINSVNFSTLLLIVALIGFGNVIANNTFIQKLLIQSLDLFDFSNSLFLNYMKLSSFMALSAVFLTQPTVPAIFTPIASHISDLSGFTILEVFMIQVAGFSTVFISFQMAPLLIGLKLANIKQIQMFKILLISAFISVILLHPLQFFWLDFIK